MTLLKETGRDVVEKSTIGRSPFIPAGWGISRPTYWPISSALGRHRYALETNDETVLTHHRAIFSADENRGAVFSEGDADAGTGFSSWHGFPAAGAYAE